MCRWRAGSAARRCRSKTDQEGQGAQIAVPNGRKLKPVEALDAWLEAAAIMQGPVFRRVMKGGRLGNRLTTQSVALIIKRWVKAARVDSNSFSGHSLRAGFGLTTRPLWTAIVGSMRSGDSFFPTWLVALLL